MSQAEQETVLSYINELKQKYNGDTLHFLQVLQAIQEKFHIVSPFALQEAAIAFSIHPSEAESVASFYSFLETKQKKGKYIIRLCNTISCDLKGKERIARQLSTELGINFGETTKDTLFSLEKCHCLGMCDQGPALLINNLLIPKVKPSDIPVLIEKCRNNSIAENSSSIISNVIVRGPLLDENFKPGEVLKPLINLEPTELLSIIDHTDLRGRGGAGFPTALKWKMAYGSVSDIKYVVCNADEGEPGTFKDRYILHKNCHRVIEGMTIAALCIGSSKGFIYLRGEYSYLKPIIESVISERNSENLLGKNILGKTGFSFDIEIRMGAGAYVCGEESALIESLEGKRGEPRNRPPYPVDTGYNDKPTIVNNVETFLDIALIFEKGAEFFKKYGTSKSTGTKFFSISGDCSREGIYELPFGITIKELLKKVGAENIKAVQIGGAAGVAVPEKEFANTIAYEAIPTGGSIILFKQDRDMLKVAINFMEFFADESCGQCTPCREGNIKLLEGLRMLEKGECSSSHLNSLIELGKTMQLASKCGLGQASPNAFLSIISNFKDEILGRV